jgi:hypothetical protein
MMKTAIARWLVLRFGNLAVRLAPHAGIEMALRIGRPKGTQTPSELDRELDLDAARRAIVPDVFDAVCRNCFHVQQFSGHMGVEALDLTCSACGAQAWRVKPHIASHQRSRRV